MVGEVSPYLELRGLSKAFGGEAVLDRMDLQVARGEMLAVLGPSGCGKSTSLRIVAGLLEQDAGEVRLGGSSLDGVPVHRRGIGFLFQNYSLFPHLSVRANIEFGLRMRKVPGEERAARAARMLALIGMEGMDDRRPSQLSGGQQQRVALARALAVGPRLLLLDEPFGALDARIRRRLRRDLKALQREIGFTTVFVTHDQEEAFEVGDRVAVMNGGRIEQVGLPRELYDEPATSFVAQFVGSVNVIYLPATGEGDAPAEVMVRPENVLLRRLGGEAGEEAGDEARDGAGGEAGGEARDGAGGEGPGRGTLVSYVFLGPTIEATVELDNGEAVSAVMSKAHFLRSHLRRGDRVGVAFRELRSFEGEPQRD